MSNYFTINQLEERQYYVVLPEKYGENNKNYPVVYVNGDKQVMTLLQNQDFIRRLSYILVITITENRLDDFSPWYAPSDPDQQNAFGGKGADYLSWVLQVLKPRIDISFRTLTDPKNTAIMGQSVGGLLSLFSIFITDSFGHIACISPSCWFPGFTDYCKKNLIEKDIHIYVSIGSLEGKEHVGLRKNALRDTNEVCDFLTAKLGEDRVRIYRDNGRHQDYLLQRFQSAMLWLDNKFKSAKG